MPSGNGNGKRKGKRMGRAKYAMKVGGRYLKKAFKGGKGAVKLAYKHKGKIFAGVKAGKAIAKMM